MIEKEELLDILRKGIVEIVFTKVEGDERTMQCTLNTQLRPDYEFSGKTRKKSDEIVTVYDIESEGWRNIRLDSIIKLTVF